MMTEDDQHEAKGDEGDDRLWRLLERAPRPGPVSPYFARRVLREVGALEEARTPVGGSAGWFARIWQGCGRTPSMAFTCVWIAGVLMAVGGMSLYSSRRHWPVAQNAALQSGSAATVPVAGDAEPPEVDPGPQGNVAVSSEPVVAPQDVEVIADLDNVLSREESRLWTEDDTARF